MIKKLKKLDFAFMCLSISLLIYTIIFSIIHVLTLLLKNNTYSLSYYLPGIIIFVIILLNLLPVVFITTMAFIDEIKYFIKGEE